MKILTLITLFLLLNYKCYSQYQTIFGDSLTEWTIAREIPDAVLTIEAEVTEDTFIYENTYKRISGSIDNYYIREDITTGQLWGYSEKEQKEHLIMDLSLDSGDRFLITRGLDPDIYIEAINVYYKDARKHIEFDYDLHAWENIGKLTFIEGIGTNAGILYQSDKMDWQFGNNHALLCYARDSVQLYSNTVFDGACFVNFGNINDQPKSKSWKLFPNPINSNATLKFENINFENHTVNVFDLSGRSVIEINNITGELVQFNRGKLPSGIYFFRLSSSGELKASGKLVIE